jgi:lipopolysaccharide export system protein LptA
MKKSLILGVVLSLSSLCFAGQKSYSVVFRSPTKVSGVKLAAGAYKVKVDGANAVFTDRKSKSFSAPVKVETGAKKFPATAVETTTDGETDKVNAIEFGGSTTRLEFM